MHVGRIKWYCNEILKRTEGSGPISSIEFNGDGSHFAYGNADGILSVVEMGLAEESEVTHARHTCSKPYLSFASHQSEFDVLKSQAIEERITFIRWLPKSAQSHFLLSTNERTIKLWRLSDVPVHQFSNMNFPTERGCRQKLILRSPSDLKVPRCSDGASFMAVRVRNKKTYDRAHSFCITGLSPSVDQETFFSSDLLRINMWHLEVTDEVYSIIDRPLDTVDEQTHLITGLDCSKVEPSVFAYCTNHGSVRVHDTRESISYDHPSVVCDSMSYDDPNFLASFVSAMSDIKFANSSCRFVFTRDYFTIKVWDLNMPSKPVETYPVQTQLQNYLTVLYESELLCDDFRLSVSSDDRFVVTGSYNKLIKVFDRQNQCNSEYPLVMQSEELGSFIDPFSNPEALGGFAQSIPDSVELPWPRLISEDTEGIAGPVAGYSSELGRFRIDEGRHWLQVCWRPESHVFAVSHVDGIHLLEALL